METQTRHDDAWRLIEAVSVLDSLDERAVAETCALVGPRLDVGRAVALAMNHNLLPALAEFLVTQERTGILPAAMRNHLTNVLEWNRFRAGRHVREAGRVLEAFEAEGVSVCFTKGVVVQSTLYDGRGTRYFGDIDVMIRPEERERVRETLLRLGFAWAKRYDPHQRQLVDIRRERLAMYRLYPDHLPHFHRLTGDEAMPVLTVDVAFSLSWYRSSWRVPIEDALAERAWAEVGEGVLLPTLTWPYTFLFMVLHLFREAWYAQSAAAYDVRLSQFADLVRLWRRATTADVAAVRGLLHDHDLGAVVRWVCHHTDTIYGAGLLAGLGLDSAADEVPLDGAGGADDGPLMWRGDMRSRLAGWHPPGFAAAASRAMR